MTQCTETWRGVPCRLPMGHEGKHQLSRVPHFGHWPGCDKEVVPAMWGCKPHWFKLPKVLRNRIWATYKPGQEITKTPSAAYLAAADEVQAWIKTHNAPLEPRARDDDSEKGGALNRVP